MQKLKQSTAFTTIVGPILDSDGVEYSGAVIGDLSITKNGTTAAMAAAATLTYISNGYYTLVGTTGNSDTVGRADVTCNKSTYQMPPKCFEVLPATVFDALVTNATTASGGLCDLKRFGGTTVTGRDIGASVLLSSGTGTGQISLSSGLVTLAGVTHTNAVIPTVTTLANLPTAPTDWLSALAVSAAAVTKIQNGLALASALATAQTTLDAINTKTTNLPSDPADASDITGEISTLTSALALIATYIDTEVAAIKAKTDQLTFTTANKVDATATATLDQDAIDDIADAVVAGVDIPTSAEIAADLSAGAITITTSPITLGNALNIYTGDAYVTTNGKSITFAITNRSDLVGLIPHLLGKSGSVTFDIAAPAVVSATQTITFGDLTAAVTATLKAGSEENPHVGEYQIRFLDGSGNKATQVSGVMYVRTGLSA